jgi:hypothetical protein
MTAEASEGRDGPSGFGGWLVLVVIGQTLAPFVTAIRMLTILILAHKTIALPGGTIALYGQLAFYAAFLFIEIVCVSAMYRRSKEYPRLFLLQWLALIVVAIGDILLPSVALNRPVLSVLGEMNMSRVLSPIPMVALWVLYMFESARVRNTFTQ